MALAPVKMTHEQRLAWLALEGWEPCKFDGGFGMMNMAYPNKALVVSEVMSARSGMFKAAILYKVRDIRRVDRSPTKQEAQLFMRKVRWLNGEDR